jgi:hypothetical protein
MKEGSEVSEGLKKGVSKASTVRRSLRSRRIAYALVFAELFVKKRP